MDQPTSSVDVDQSPPGTILLQVCHGDELRHEEIILRPTPTSDPNDPLNWKKWEKGINFTLVLFYSLLIYSLLGVSTPTWEPLNIELGFSYENLANSYAVGSAALCFGVMFFMPFALKFGRRPAYILSTLLQVAVSVWAAKLQTVPEWMLINVFNCFLGSLAEAIVQMTIADLFFIHTRGAMTSIYVWVVIVAISLSPVAAGYITTNQGWRWVWGWVIILLGVCFILFFFFYEETKFTRRIDGTAPVSHSNPNNTKNQAPEEDQKEKNTHKAVEGIPGTNNCTQISSISFCVPPRAPYVQRLKLWSASPESFTTLFYQSLRPFIMIITMPGVTYAALMYGIVTACYQVSVTVIAAYMVYPPYSFNSAQIGLMSGIPGFIGTSIGAIISGLFSDRIVYWLAKRNRGVYEPEMRLWLLLAFGIFIPAGLLMFGYGLSEGKPWAIFAVGSGLFTFGMTPASGMVLAYATDAYTNIIADVMVGVVFVRNAFATILVVALTPWVNAVGIANVFLTLALIALFAVLLGIALLVYGKRFRVRTAARYEAWSAGQSGLLH